MTEIASDLSEMVDEIRYAATDLKALRPKAKAAMESETGFSAEALAHLYAKAAPELERLTADIARMGEALRLGEAALQKMMDTWLDYHDAHSLTQPVTGASSNAFEDALVARDAAHAALQESGQ